MFCVLLNLCLFEHYAREQGCAKTCAFGIVLFKLLRCLLREGA